MNTYTVENDAEGFRVRVTGSHGGAGHLVEQIFATEAEAEAFAADQLMLENGRAGMSPEDRPL